MDEAMNIADVDTIMAVPPDLAVCPICKQPLFITEYACWTQCEDGLYMAAEVHLECRSEPDFEDPGYDDWFEGHYSMPYVDWLPVSQRVLAWHQRHYRFDLDGILATDAVLSLSKEHTEDTEK